MSGWYCVRLMYDSDQLCMTKLDGNGRCDKRHASGHGGCCEHGFELCVHGQCELECSAWPGCEASLEHEYACMCDTLMCSNHTCKGECGCRGCRTAYADFLSSE